MLTIWISRRTVLRQRELVGTPAHMGLDDQSRAGSGSKDLEYCASGMALAEGGSEASRMLKKPRRRIRFLRREGRARSRRYGVICRRSVRANHVVLSVRDLPGNGKSTFCRADMQILNY